MSTPPKPQKIPTLLLPDARFRPLTYTPEKHDLSAGVWRFKLPMTWTPKAEISIDRIALEPDADYEPLIGAKRPGSRDSRGMLRIERGSLNSEFDAIALMDSTTHGSADGGAEKLPDLVGNLSERLARLSNGDQQRAGEAVGLIIDFIQSYSQVRGERLKIPILLNSDETLRAWVDHPRGEQHVVFYGASQKRVF